MKKTLYYVRVSTVEQKLDRQLLAYGGADKIYIDKVSGKDKNRPNLQLMLKELQEGDTVVVKSLDRLSRSASDTLSILEEIEKKGASLKIIDMAIDTATPLGKCMITITGAFAELERKMIRQRTKEGIEIAKEQGKFKGRQKGAISIKDDQLKSFKKKYLLGMSITDLAKDFSVTRATIYSWIKVLKEKGEIKEE
ncbi:MAG: recombinase family protein [Cetobacterium sp.]